MEAQDDGLRTDTVDEADQDAGGGTRRARGVIAAIVLGLLLLLTFCAARESLNDVRIRQATFVMRNAECLSCHVEVVAQMGLASQHQPFAAEQCTSCHSPHGAYLQVRERVAWRSAASDAGLWLRWGPLRWLIDPPEGGTQTAGGSETDAVNGSNAPLGRSELKAPVNELCWSCHPQTAAELSLTVQHPPFEIADCTSCHNPHAGPVRPLLEGSDRVVCGSCHPLSDLERAHLHQPAEDWQCRSCHSPHSSDHNGMLIARQGELCLSCHPSVATDLTMNVLHRPFGTDDCTGCHEPHGAEAQPLLIAAQPELCYRCHPRVEGQFAMESHHPLGQSMQCATCHEVHAAPYPGLLRTESNNLCYTCHGVLRARFQASKHGQIDCASCHNPHGSQYVPLLQEMNPSLCQGCHRNSEAVRFSGDNTHPARPNYLDRKANAPLTCTSTCHDPHGSGYQYMVRNYPWFWDGTCLQCHVDVGIEF